MIQIENAITPSDEQWEAVIRGMRNPMNSWARSDSGRFFTSQLDFDDSRWKVGENDMRLMQNLRGEGQPNRKFLRMIPVYVDITAPLYWWKEYDTYKVGTVANSCSTMHTISSKEFSIDDFSHEHLFCENDCIPEEHRGDLSEDKALTVVSVDGELCYFTPYYFMQMTCDVLNYYRKLYLETKNKQFWWQLIQLLPSSYNQRRTLLLNYEVLLQIYTWRKHHKLNEWHVFCDWIETLPNAAELIVAERGCANGQHPNLY